MLTASQRRLRDKLLRESGFVDIEDADGVIQQARNRIVGQHGQRIANLAEIETVAEYYRLCAKLLHDHPFKSPVERRIWELHAEGASYTRTWHTIRREIEA